MSSEKIVKIPHSARTEIFGNGEMAELTRRFDWQKTGIGSIDQWPQTLLTTVNLLLASRHPMFLWWGPNLIQFYNDAFRPSIRRDKHPKALGQRGIECWPEIWPIIAPQIEGVMNRGESTWHENQLVPIYRDNKIEDAYWTYSYSPVRDSSGRIRGTLVVCNETTQQVIYARKLRISEEHLRLTQRAAKIGSWELDLGTEEYVWSPEVFDMFGLAHNFRPTQRNFLSLLFVSGDKDAVIKTLQRSATKNKEYKVRFRISTAGEKVRWIEARGHPYYNLGKPLILGVFIDITETLESEAQPRRKRSGKKS